MEQKKICEDNLNSFQTENENELMVKKRYGFLPLSIWYLVKNDKLQHYISDDLGIGSYGDKTKQQLSQFNPTVAEKIIKIWSKKGDKILDHFSGRCRALIAQLLERQYTGYEISPKVYTQLMNRINKKTLTDFKSKPIVYNKDCRLMEHNDEFNLIFTCPPYWDVEDYNKAYDEDVDGQLSNYNTYEYFLREYEIVIKKCFFALKIDGFVVWVVSDIRRNKELIPFSSDTIKIFQKCGFIMHDIIINKLNSLAVMGVGSALNNKYTPKIHEYILVFKK